MVNIKHTARKSRSPTEHGFSGTHPCRFPGCGKRFAFRQNMSRHMKNVHKVAAKSFVDYRLKTASPRNAPSEYFDDERDVIGAFQGAGATPGTAEGELALNTLSEVLESMPTLYTLGCESLTHRDAVEEVLIVSSDSESDTVASDADLPALYAGEDQYDTLEIPVVKPNPKSCLNPTISCRRVSVNAPQITKKGKAPQNKAKGKAPSNAKNPRYVPGIPGEQSKGKDLRLEWELQFESAHWPTQPAKVSSSDIVKVLQKFPKASPWMFPRQSLITSKSPRVRQLRSVVEPPAWCLWNKASSRRFVVCFRWRSMRRVQ